MKLIQYFNAITLQTWSVLFVFLGVGLTVVPHGSAAGTLLVGGGLALIRFEVSSGSPPKSE